MQPHRHPRASASLRAMGRVLGLWACGLLACGGDGREPTTSTVGASTGQETTGVTTGGETGPAGTTADGDSEGSQGTTAADPTAADPAEQAIAEARELYPTYLDLHAGVVARTCTPNEGVCHNQKEYPDLHTPQTMLAAIGAPCNFAEEEPKKIYGGCESQGDILSFTDGPNADPMLAYKPEVAYVEWIKGDMDIIVAANIYLSTPIPLAMTDPMVPESVRIDRSENQIMVPVGQIAGAISYQPGQKLVTITDYTVLPDPQRQLLETKVRPGDPNQDGVFGAKEDPHRMILPGDPEHSYLLQRLQGKVPGSPMPLANQPLSSAEIIALACWIESLAGMQDFDPYIEINYDNCRTADEFGAGDPESGHSLSADVQPILDANCATAGCHANFQPASALDLSRDHARDSLLKMSIQDPKRSLVEPGNPTGSYLIIKLTGNGASGVQMPRTYDGKPGQLPESDIQVIKDWIVAGAPSD